MRHFLVVLLAFSIVGLLFTAVDVLMCAIALSAGCLLATIHAVIKAIRE